MGLPRRPGEEIPRVLGKGGFEVEEREANSEEERHGENDCRHLCNRVELKKKKRAVAVSRDSGSLLLD